MKNTITLLLISSLLVSCQVAPPTLDDAKNEIAAIIDTKSHQNIKLLEFTEIESRDTIIENSKMYLIKFNGTIEYKKAGFANTTPFITKNKENTFLNILEEKNPFLRNYIHVEKGAIKNINGFIYHSQKENNWDVHRLGFGLKN